MSNIDAAQVAVESIQNVSSLVEMNQHKWGSEKTDSKTTAEVKAQKNARGRAGKYRVNLANGFERDLQTLTRIMSRAYHTHMRMTMPWGDGERMLPNLSLIPYLGAMQEFKSELDKAKAALAPELPRLITNAVSLNGDLGNAADYPSPADIVDAYSFDFDFTPVADASGFSGLPEGFQETFVDKYNSRVQDRMADGVQDMYKRLVEVLVPFNESLTKEKPKFFATTFEKLHQLSTTLMQLNIAGDTAVAEVADACITIASYTPAQVRDNMTIRTAVQHAVDATLVKLRGVDATPSPQEPEVIPDPVPQVEEPVPEPVSTVETTVEAIATAVDNDIANLFDSL